MADQPKSPLTDLKTVPKQLHQIGWEGGMTEGDVGPQTVQDLLNVELDVEGQLRPRNVLLNMATNPNRQYFHNGAEYVPIDFKYMQKPTDSSVIYSVMLTTHSIVIFNDTDLVAIVGVTLFSAEGGGVSEIDKTSTLTINGSDIYISAIDPVTKLPIGIFRYMYLESSTRFRLPLYTDATGLSRETPVAARWALIGPSGIFPILHLLEVAEFWGRTPYNNRENFYSNACGLCGSMKTAVVLAATIVRDRDTKASSLMGHFTPMAVEKTFSVDMCVQFVYVDGTHSVLSNPVSLSVTTSVDGQCVGIATTVCVNSSFPQVVASINVYRRILKRDTDVTSDLEWELLYTADISSTILAQKDRVSSASIINKAWSNFEDIDMTCTGITSLVRKATGFDVEILADGGSKRTFEGVCAYTSGWFNCWAYTADDPDSYLMVYCPKTLIGLGIHTVWTGNIPDFYNEDSFGNYYKQTIGAASPNGAVVAYGWESLLGSNTYCLGANQDALSPWLINTFYYYYPARTYRGAINNYPAGLTLVEETQSTSFGAELGGTVIYLNTPSSVKTNYGTDGPITGNGGVLLAPRVLFMFVDNSQSGMSVENVSGVSETEASVVHPRKITFSAGRMIGLNVVQDGEEIASRLVYSEFRRPFSFRKSNYVDYNTRDDGKGVAIAAFAGRLLVLNTTSSYILDISGGSDMSWRELGAYNDIGAINDKAVVTTNVGIFFASQSDVYWFDGNKLVKITEMEGRRVSSAYRLMDKSKVTLAWRSSLRQLWVCECASNILVFDMDRGAWHRHVLSELDFAPNITKPIRFNNINNVEFLTLHYTLGLIDIFSGICDNPTTQITTPFQWGVTTGLVNMGSSEIVKKSKSFYLDLAGVTGTSGNIDIWYTDVNSTPDKSITPGITRAVHRVRTSVRSSWLNFKVLAKLNGSTYWRGSIESLGLSYKPKRLK
jgi:hypothetical protein